MAEASIPVDLLNPGQVLACLGFLEAAEILSGNARGGFDWSNEADIRFRLSATGDANPFETVLLFLRDANVTSRSARELGLDTSKWSVETRQYSSDEPFPFLPPASPATLTAVLSAQSDNTSVASKTIEISYWGDDRRVSGRDNAKFWGGAGGYPGARFALNLLEQARPSVDEFLTNPFALSAEMTSSFRFDWRRDYVDLDIGFSLNKHAKGRFRSVGFPLVEVLAAIGLSHARPEFHDRLTYRYGVLGAARDGDLLDPIFLRASLGTTPLPFPQRTFLMNLSWPGQEGYDRSITNVFEETNND